MRLEAIFLIQFHWILWLFCFASHRTLQTLHKVVTKLLIMSTYIVPLYWCHGMAMKSQNVNKAITHIGNDFRFNEWKYECQSKINVLIRWMLMPLMAFWHQNHFNNLWNRLNVRFAFEFRNQSFSSFLLKGDKANYKRLSNNHRSIICTFHIMAATIMIINVRLIWIKCWK